MYMKKVICLFVLLIMPLSVKATSGCCSSHGGVDCSRDQSNGRVICNDGWTGSSCSYSSITKCSGYTTKQTTVPVSYKYGCTDSSAINYDSSANKDDGSCIATVYGCTNQESSNYNKDANKDDGSCIPFIYGCMDEKAINYNEQATKDDLSCEYEEEKIVEENTKNNIKEGTSDPVGTIVGTGALTGLGYFIYKKVKKKS